MVSFDYQYNIEESRWEAFLTIETDKVRQYALYVHENDFEPTNVLNLFSSMINELNEEISK